MGSNLDGDCLAMMEEVELINNDISCSDMCRLSDSKLVNMGSLISSMYRSVADNISIPQNIGGNYTRFCHVGDSGIGCNDTSLFGDITNSFRVESDYSVDETTNRAFRLYDIHVLSHLKRFYICLV